MTESNMEFLSIINTWAMVFGSLSSWYGMSLDCGWRIWPPDMEGGHEYID